MSDYANLASGSKIFSSSDNFSESGLLGPTIPMEMRAVDTAEVRLGRHVVVGAGSIIMPGSEIGEGATVGALSLVKGRLAPWTVYGGIPAKALKQRDRRALELAKSFQNSNSDKQ